MDVRLRLVWYDEDGCQCIVGVDTPELRSRDATERQRAQEAKAYTESWLAQHAAYNTRTKTWAGAEQSYFVIRTEKDDAFGRYLADVRDQAGNSLGKDLLDTGHAVVWQP
jgi:endonuclease YncB( thermonuclease family)